MCQEGFFKNFLKPFRTFVIRIHWFICLRFYKGSLPSSRLLYLFIADKTCSVWSPWKINRKLHFKIWSFVPPPSSIMRAIYQLCYSESYFSCFFVLALYLITLIFLLTLPSKLFISLFFPSWGTKSKIKSENALCAVCFPRIKAGRL